MPDAVDQHGVKQSHETSFNRVHSLTDQPPASGGTITIRQLAHELNSLLDGAARCVRQVQSRLAEPHDATDTDSPGPAGNEQIAQKLQLACTSMQQMGVLLQRAMDADEPNRQILASDRVLGEYVPDLIASLRPKAREHQVAFNLHMTNDAAAVPTGPLGTVLLNGLSNALDACIRSTNMPRVIEVSVSIKSHSELVILVSDTGPGVIETCRTGDSSLYTVKPGGHGIGLDLSRQIIDDLGGRLQLTNIPFGAGAILHVCVPVRRLCAA